MEIINSKWVRVVLKNPGDTTLWFSIGHLDAFERNLVQVQSEAGIELKNFVSTFYRSENKFGILDYLLAFAVLQMLVLTIACLRAIGKKTGMRGRIFLVFIY